jgi:GMP synthase-like glutamine amidotransferase
MIALAPSHKNQLNNYTSWLQKREIPYRILETGDTLENFKMLVLCGGPDVGTSPQRDENETRWLSQAYGKIPVLGICRGMQIANVFLGGTLHDDLPESPVTHTADKKLIASEPQPLLESRWHPVKMGEKTINVNSRHHQGVKDLAPGMKPIAFCEDGLVEMMEGQMSLFVQWHPERPEVWGTEAETIVYDWISANYQKTSPVDLILDYMKRKDFTVLSVERVKKLDPSLDVEKFLNENSRTFKRTVDKKGRYSIKHLKQ